MERWCSDRALLGQRALAARKRQVIGTRPSSARTLFVATRYRSLIYAFRFSLERMQNRYVPPLDADQRRVE